VRRIIAANTTARHFADVTALLLRGYADNIELGRDERPVNLAENFLGLSTDP
jgi:hypothetical protein